MISSSQSSLEEGEDDAGIVWMKTGVYVSELPDAQYFPPRYQFTVTGKIRKKGTASEAKCGRKIEVNGKEIALFRYQEIIFAVDDACPHMGGPLHLGDIEELDGQVCVSCPWHNWTFNLQNGLCLISDHHQMIFYQVKVSSREEIYIGFDGLDQDVFSSQEF